MAGREVNDTQEDPMHVDNDEADNAFDNIPAPGSDVKDVVMVNGSRITSILDAIKARIWR